MLPLKPRYKLPSIDDNAFLRSVAKPQADPAVIEAARALGASVENPLLASVVASFWESSAPMAWVDGRGDVPRLFMDRGRPPWRSAAAKKMNLSKLLHLRPTSLELAASLAADPEGVVTAQAIAEEFLGRLRDWCDAPIPSRIGWCLADPRLYSYGPYAWEFGDEYSTPFWLGNDVLRAQGADAALLETAIRGRLAAKAKSELKRRGWTRQDAAFRAPNDVYRDAQRLPTNGFVIERAADALGDWLCTRAAASAGASTLGFMSGIGKLEGRKISDLPDPLDPLLTLYGTGYFPAWIDRHVFLIGVPWSGPTISESTIFRLWDTVGQYGEHESLAEPAAFPLTRWDSPLSTVTGSGTSQRVLRRGP